MSDLDQCNCDCCKNWMTKLSTQVAEIQAMVGEANRFAVDLGDTIVASMRKFLDLPDSSAEEVEAICREKFPGKAMMSDILLAFATDHEQAIRRDEREKVLEEAANSIDHNAQGRGSYYADRIRALKGD